MKNKKVLGYWIVVGTMTIGLAVTALFKGESINPSSAVRVLAVLLAGAVLLLIQSALAWAWRLFSKLAPTRNPDRYARDPAARVVSTENRDWELELAQELRTRYGWKWRYFLPWVLVSGDDRLVTGQLPVLAKKQWCATNDVVLLWAPRNKSGLPDEAWLLKLRKLRGRRPVDAIAFVIDGRSDPSALARRTASLGSLFFGISRMLRFSAPVYLVADSGINAMDKEAVDPVGCLLPRKYDDGATADALRSLSNNLAITGTKRLVEDRRLHYLAGLSVQIEHRCKALTDLMTALSTSVRSSLNIRGLWFLPAAAGQVTADPEANGLSRLWGEIGKCGIKSGGRRTGWHPSSIFASVVTTLACVWIAGMFISGGSNTHELVYANQLARQQVSAPDSRSGLHTLLDTQQNIERFEYRASSGAPWYSRFGLNRDREILAGLWNAYTPASRRLLVSPTQQGLESSLGNVAAMRTDVSDDATSKQALAGHKTLRTYLMLAEPKRADAKDMVPELTWNWITNASLTVGERLDLAHQFFPFFAQHLAAHPEWAIQPRTDLVNNTRQVLLALIGTRNSTDTIYHSILDTATGKYGDQTLATLLAGTDARGLFRTSATVPGVYTRQAWDGQISQAIDEAAQRQNVTTDWVLNATANNQPTQSVEELRKALRDMYFDEYARQWQAFANSIQWVSAPTLPAIAEQLRLFADSRQSPMIALMKALDYQGRAGENIASLSDNLVAKAQSLIGNHAVAGAVEGAAQAIIPPEPLDAAFGPVLRLVSAGQQQGKAADSNISLQRYLDTITSLRLKIEAMTNSGSMDDQARRVAQSQFQGKSSELSDTRTYASLVAASLGEQWSGLGESLFLRPVDQSMQAVMQPAQASLNDAWRQTIVEPWTRAFQGRYPFASSDDDASFPELVRFLRDQTGLVPAFVNQQLAGALELHGDRWVPGSAGAGLRFDPAFLKAINVLQGIASHMLASGAAQYRFDLMPQPSADVTQTQFTVDGQTLKYLNTADRWQPFVWPGNDLLVTGTRLEWQTVQSGLNKGFEKQGRWAFVRMLASANVEPLSDTRYKLTWIAIPGPVPTTVAAAAVASNPATASAPTMASDPTTLTAKAPETAVPKSVTHPLTWVMRTDAGRGPLELLALRGFVMPTRIFAPAAAPGPARMQNAGPPPLPASAVAAARHAAISLPHGAVPDSE
ncbi:type VI secretion system protein ImpL [Paraburkholderia bannensis]|uniref:Type VI secretion system protein ImpL n=1 Tax=Paraburkholderia bannensis TaxID=765414 RepID=A0A7W9TZU9_9BURK|nr:MULTISPECIES: ImcF-related family protein [Paraburkholderia]MBB3259388.1 type VI secretion system protein ImpL [Paraburkholderia sp. WP4_3_2]MBB6104404.1 type VI secretion system protein ImpL [Paraburkholderia bannensis]